MKIQLFGDFDGCGYSRAAKEAVENWLKTTPYCRRSTTVDFVTVGLGDMRSYKMGGRVEGNLSRDVCNQTGGGSVPGTGTTEMKSLLGILEKSKPRLILFGK